MYQFNCKAVLVTKNIDLFFSHVDVFTSKCVRKCNENEQKDRKKRQLVNETRLIFISF